MWIGRGAMTGSQVTPPSQGDQATRLAQGSAQRVSARSAPVLRSASPTRTRLESQRSSAGSGPPPTATEQARLGQGAREAYRAARIPGVGPSRENSSGGGRLENTEDTIAASRTLEAKAELSQRFGDIELAARRTLEANTELSHRFGDVESCVLNTRAELGMNISVLSAESAGIKSMMAEMQVTLDVLASAMPKTAQMEAQRMDAKMDTLIAEVQRCRESVLAGKPVMSPRASDGGPLAVAKSPREASGGAGLLAAPKSPREASGAGTPGKPPPAETDGTPEALPFSALNLEHAAEPAAPPAGHAAAPRPNMPKLDLSFSGFEVGMAARMADNVEEDGTGRSKFRQMIQNEDEPGGQWKQSIEERLEARRKKKEFEPDLIKRIGKSMHFQILSVSIILLAVALMAAQTELQVTKYIEVNLCTEGKGPAPKDQDLTSFFENIEWAMLLWMCIELGINIYVAGAMFSGEGSSWNIFDMGIITASVLQKIFSGINMSGLRVLRIGRVMKFVRIFKVLKAFKAAGALLGTVRRMVICLIASFSSLFWAIVLIFFILFITAIMLMQGIEVWYDFTLEGTPAMSGQCSPGGPGSGLWDGKGTYNEIFPRFQVDPENDTHTEQVKKLYGTVDRTIMTLFSTISGGSEWQVVADPVVKISEVFYVLWVLYICVFFYGVLNVFTGIFCETAMAAAASDTQTIMRQELEEVASCQATLRDAFGKIDVDNSGSLTESELELVLTDPFVIATLMKIGLQASESKGLFRLLDEDRSGTLSCEEFVDGCISLKGGARRVDVVTLMTQNRRLTKTVNSLMEMCDSMWTNLEQGLKQSRSV